MDMKIVMRSVSLMKIACLLAAVYPAFSFVSLRRSAKQMPSILHSSEALAPVPKVPSSAWRWPPNWPFPADFLVLAPFLAEDSSSVNKKVESLISASAKERFHKHIGYFLSENHNILEIGCNVDSFIDSIKYTNAKRFFIDAANANFNLSDPYLPFESSSFDTLVFSIGVEYVPAPRDLFSEMWRVLKPGGRCLVCFTNIKNAFAASELQQVQMWTTMTSEQKIWIAGSYFHYSAFEGFQDIEGYDLFSMSAPIDVNNKSTMVFETRDTEDVAYVVQAQKKIFASDIDDANFSASDLFANCVEGLRNLESDDKLFLSLRLQADFEKAVSREDKLLTIRSVDKLPRIYSLLREVKEIIIPSPIKAMLASVLLPSWRDTEEQRAALMRGVGLDTTEQEYWPLLGRLTAQLKPKDKIAFLGDLISEFGETPRVLHVPKLLEELTAALQQKFSDATPEKLLAVATDICISDYLRGSSKSATEDFDRVVRFAKSLSKQQLEEIMSSASFF